MLRELTLENFKAFRQRAVMPMAPITLIFGENSAGKSSILQSLALLKQSWEQLPTDQFLLFKPRHPIVDLGSYAEAVYGHDAELPMTFGLAVAQEQQVHRLEFEFRHDPETTNARLVGAAIPLNDQEYLARYTWVDAIPDERLRSMDAVVYGFEGIGAAGALRGSALTQSEFHWKRAYDSLKQSLPRLNTAIENDYGDDFVGVGFDIDTGQFAGDIPRMLEFLRMPRPIREGRCTIKDYIAWITSCFLDSVIDLAGLFRPTFVLGSLPMAQSANPNELLISGCAALRNLLASLVPLGPVRSGPRRWYEQYSVSVNHVGYEGSYAPQLLLTADDDRQQVNYWLDRLGIGYEIALEPLTPDLFAVKLIDTRSSGKIEVSMANVGYGVSQVLPIITQSLISKGALITVEQPELHIHPRLQAELGDLFAAGIKPPYNNQFIIETHSEHLILRLQRLVRTGVLTPDQISVLFVLRGKEDRGSEVVRLRLDEEGDFIDEWPGGFFPERLNELL